MIDIGFLKNMPMFSGLTSVQLNQIRNHMSEVIVKRGDPIIRDGETGDTMYLLFEGEVEVSKRLTLRMSQMDFDERDKQFIRFKAADYAFFGEMALFEKQSIRSAAVVAVEDSRLAVLDKESFERFCTSDYRAGYTILHNIVGVLCERLNKANQDILKLTTAFSIALEDQ